MANDAAWPRISSNRWRGAFAKDLASGSLSREPRPLANRAKASAQRRMSLHPRGHGGGRIREDPREHLNECIEPVCVLARQLPRKMEAPSEVNHSLEPHLSVTGVA